MISDPGMTRGGSTEGEIQKMAEVLSDGSGGCVIVGKVGFHHHTPFRRLLHFKFTSSLTNFGHRCYRVH